MSLGPEKIILILVVALIVFGPQRLPEIARQVGAMIRELRRMQDSVRGELEQVLHPDFTAPDADGRTSELASGDAVPGAIASGATPTTPRCRPVRSGPTCRTHPIPALGVPTAA